MAKGNIPRMNPLLVNEMTQLVEEHGAINLSSEYANFPCPEMLVERASYHLSNGKNHYAPTEGVPELRKTLVERYKRFYGSSYSWESEVNITAGATQGLYAAISAIIREGDEVIVVEPAYTSYLPSIEAAGGYPVFVQLKLPDFHIDWDEIQKVITTRTKMIILNTPHNPTGSVMVDSDFERLQRIVNGTRIVLLVDESGRGLVYKEEGVKSIAAYPKLAERAIIVSSYGKSLNITGWKIGYVLAPQALMAEIRRVHLFHVYSVNAPLQYALADYLNSGENFIELQRKKLEQRMNLFNEAIAGSRFTTYPPAGGCFQVLGYDAVSQEKDLDFVLWLAREKGVAAMPVSPYFHDFTNMKLVRVCLGKSEEELLVAAQRLRTV